MAKMRSPRYPNIPFGEAVNRAKMIYERENMSPMTPQVAVEAMGYTGINGASLKMISSLRKYGLLEGRGDDVRLTKDAQTLAIDDQDSPDFQAAVARNALRPDIFSELRKQFPGQASTRNISVYLEKNGFMPDAAKNVAENYTATLALAESVAGGYSVPESDESDDDQVQESEPIASGVAARVPETRLRTINSAPAASEVIGTEKAPFRVTQNGDRLSIVANVDLASLRKLQKTLTAYETILEMANMSLDDVVPVRDDDEGDEDGEE